jgi:putative acetyltransferase
MMAVLIRREREADVAGVDEVHRAAFAAAAPDGTEPVEAGLVRALRLDPGWVPALSWVAEDDDGAIVGHVVCTKGTVGDVVALGLGPIGVRPSHQGHHVGHALMHSVIGAADALDHPLIALLGHLDYYPRFGFVPAASVGVEAPDPAWGDNFQVRTLAAHTPDVRGRFRYARPFEDV